MKSSWLGLGLVALADILISSSSLRAESVVFDGETYELAYNAKNEVQVLKEFLLKGEKLENWTKLTAIFDFLQHRDPKPLAFGLLDEVKKQNPQAAGQVMENEETGEYLVSFISWPQDESYVEFNVFRYSKGMKSVKAQQFAMRSYGDYDAFFKKVGEERDRYLELMAKDGLKVKP